MLIMLRETLLSTILLEVRQICNVFFKPTILPKTERTNSFFWPNSPMIELFRSFFGRIQGQQKVLSKLTDLYLAKTSQKYRTICNSARTRKQTRALQGGFIYQTMFCMYFSIKFMSFLQFTLSLFKNRYFALVADHQFVYVDSVKGSFNNYVDRILPFFDPLPCVDIFIP